MIDLHYWPTPNGYKVGLMLEECALEHRIYPVNIGQGDQFVRSFWRFHPITEFPPSSIMHLQINKDLSRCSNLGPF